MRLKFFLYPSNRPNGLERKCLFTLWKTNIPVIIHAQTATSLATRTYSLITVFAICRYGNPLLTLLVSTVWLLHSWMAHVAEITNNVLVLKSTSLELTSWFYTKMWTYRFVSPLEFNHVRQTNIDMRILLWAAYTHFYPRLLVMFFGKLYGCPQSTFDERFEI